MSSWRSWKRAAKVGRRTRNRSSIPRGSPIVLDSVLPSHSRSRFVRASRDRFPTQCGVRKVHQGGQCRPGILGEETVEPLAFRIELDGLSESHRAKVNLQGLARLLPSYSPLVRPSERYGCHCLRKRNSSGGRYDPGLDAQPFSAGGRRRDWLLHRSAPVRARPCGRAAVPPAQARYLSRGARALRSARRPSSDVSGDGEGRGLGNVVGSPVVLIQLGDVRTRFHARRSGRIDVALRLGQGGGREGNLYDF
jgi:hypothetical protein